MLMKEALPDNGHLVPDKHVLVPGHVTLTYLFQMCALITSLDCAALNILFLRCMRWGSLGGCCHAKNCHTAIETLDERCIEPKAYASATTVVWLMQGPVSDAQPYFASLPCQMLVCHMHQLVSHSLPTHRACTSHALDYCDVSCVRAAWHLKAGMA